MNGMDGRAGEVSLGSEAQVEIRSEKWEHPFRRTSTPRFSGGYVKRSYAVGFVVA